MNENVDPTRVEARPQSRAPAPGSPTDAPIAPSTAPKPPKKRRLARWLFILAIAIACFFAWQRFEDVEPTPDVAPKGGRAAGAAGAPQTIRDAEAVKGDIPLYVDALGTVTSLATVTVRTQIAGTLQQIGFSLRSTRAPIRRHWLRRRDNWPRTPRSMHKPKPILRVS
jgi:hypothetical protein